MTGERIRSAIVQQLGELAEPAGTLGVLARDDVPKAGSSFDLALALAILAASDQVPVASVDRVLWSAELGLDGRLRRVRGVLPAVLAASSGQDGAGGG